MREAFNSTTPEAGSDYTRTTLTPSPSPRRRRSTATRDRRGPARSFGGYDGADDDDFVVHSAETEDGIDGHEVVRPCEVEEPEEMVLNLKGARTFPMGVGDEKESGGFAYGYGGKVPPTPPSTVR